MADQAEYKEFGRELREMGASDESPYGNVGVFDHLFNPYRTGISYVIQTDSSR
jgi:hypothetical protein